jgi:formylglycine-generating enzyme
MKELYAVCLGASLLAWESQAQTPPTLGVQVVGGMVRLRIAGEVGSICTIQSTTNLSGTSDWQFVTNLVPLLSSPSLMTDPSALTARRFYRAYAQRAPSNLVWMAAGSFLMGSPTTEAQRYADETQHIVTLTKGFYMCKREVRQAEYAALMGSNPSYFKTQDWYGNPISPDPNRPVEQVSWTDAASYCGQLTQQEQAAGRLPEGWVYRLPTESEWEYACRAGTTSAFNFGNAIHGGMANFYDYWEYDATTGDSYVASPTVPWLPRTTTVGSYPATTWGLYDMHGNVSEWCGDWYDAYPEGTVNDPQGPASGTYRVFRGGGWLSLGRYCRSAQRNYYYPSYSDYSIGFRVVMAAAQP